MKHTVMPFVKKVFPYLSIALIAILILLAVYTIFRSPEEPQCNAITPESVCTPDQILFSDEE